MASTVDKPGPVSVAAAAYAGISRALGALLIVAAGLKVYELAGEPEARPNSIPWGTAALAGFELLLGLWLLSGIYRRWSWRVTLLCFIAFASYSASRAMSGVDSCGCFGSVKVSPWLAAVFDVGVVGFLLAIPPGPSWKEWTQQPHAWCVPALLGTAAAALATFGVLQGAAVTPLFERPGSGSSDSVVWPEKWAGQPFPLLRANGMPGQIEHGTWTLVFYRHQCAHCLDLLERVSDMQRAGRLESSRPVVLVELPPYGFITAGPKSDSTTVFSSRLRDDRKWMMVMPVVVYLEDGIVVQVDGGGGLLAGR